MCLILLILGAAALAVYIPEKIRGYTVKAVLKKSVVSLLFIAVAAAAGSQTILAQFIIVGLVCGLLGDIWLDLKYVYPQHDDIYTYAGFAVFGIGHVLYVTGLIIQYGGGLFLIASFALAVIGAIGNDLMGTKVMKLRFGKMRPVVFVYAFLLFCTVFVSGGLLLKNGVTMLLMFFIGSVLFAVSDLILSGTYFGEGKERPVDIISNYVCYYAAQFLIAYSLTFR